MSDTRPRRPVPRIDEETRGFWEACARHELYVQRCRACRTFRHPPRAVCPACLSSDVDWVRSSGRGTVYSFTVTHQNQAPGFRERLPYVLAVVQLDEGVREGWITADERKQLEELREMTLDTIMVDDFEPWELRSAAYVERDGSQPKAHREAA